MEGPAPKLYRRTVAALFGPTATVSGKVGSLRQPGEVTMSGTFTVALKQAASGVSQPVKMEAM